MGYRSSMVLCIKKDVYKKLQILNQHFPSLFNEDFTESRDTYDESLMYFTAEELKMYTSYPEVAEFYKWLETVVLVENYHFIESGEDTGDVTESGELHHTMDTDMYTQTIITYPGGSL